MPDNIAFIKVYASLRIESPIINWVIVTLAQENGLFSFGVVDLL